MSSRQGPDVQHSFCDPCFPWDLWLFPTLLGGIPSISVAGKEVGKGEEFFQWGVFYPHGSYHLAHTWTGIKAPYIFLMKHFSIIISLDFPHNPEG